MSFWTKLFPGPDDKPPSTAHGGDPHGVELVGEPVAARALPQPWTSPWDGWPATWTTPAFGGNSQLSKLVDAAWAAIDLNASILSAMPVYRLSNGQIAPPLPWMTNPDPQVYNSWSEFMKQMTWDLLAVGEVFVLPMAHYAGGLPSQFRVIPGWLMNCEMRGAEREYTLGGVDVTREILHIRYQSTTDDAHGHGPLEVAGARITAASLLQRYAHRIAETGGTPFYWMEVERRLQGTEAEDLQTQWLASRTKHAGEPAIVSGGAQLKQAQSMNARDMTLLELSQFNEARISVLCGTPPFLIGLPSALGESMTYSNTENLFDFHDRASLRPKANMLMSALSWWALPRGQSVELNRDDYTRPGFKERADAWKVLKEIGAVSVDEIRAAERFTGDAPQSALTGAEIAGTPPVQAAPAPAPAPGAGP